MSNTFSVTDAHDIISKKILINRMSIKGLLIQGKLSKAKIDIEKIIYESCREKIKLIRELNEVFEKQLSEFCEIRQEECKNYYDDIAVLDKDLLENSKLMELFKDCKKYESELIDLGNRISYIESTIPSEKLVTNYKVKLDNQDGTNILTNNCASEVLQKGI